MATISAPAYLELKSGNFVMFEAALAAPELRDQMTAKDRRRFDAIVRRLTWNGFVQVADNDN